MFKEVVLYGGMTINEWRLGCNMSPLEGGDERIMRLDAAPVDDSEESLEDDYDEDLEEEDIEEAEDDETDEIDAQFEALKKELEM